jgi:peptidoglycan/LPS O-acetylase OafA/YrhL
VHQDVTYSYGFLDPLISKGGLGVEVFFVLSGFIMTVRYQSVFGNNFKCRDYFSYAAKRLARIWPLHILCVLGMTIGAIGSYYFLSSELEGSRFNVINVISSIFLFSFYFESIVDINMPAWTLSAEMFAYILLPFVFYAFRSNIGKFCIWASVCVFILTYTTPHLDAAYRLLCGYAMGVFIAEFLFRKLSLKTTLALCIFSFLCYWYTYSYIVLLFFFGCTVLILCRANPIFEKFPVSITVSTWLGRLSFPVYIVHWPVRTYIRNIVEVSGYAISDAALISLYFIVSIILAYFLHIMFEEPMRKYITARITN